jgi:hypothetical protein
MPPISSASEKLDSNGPIIADFNTRDTDLGWARRCRDYRCLLWRRLFVARASQEGNCR